MRNDMFSISKNIDWADLRQQKAQLILRRDNDSRGLIHLIDHIQDEAVNQGVATESEVFGQ